MAQYLNDGVKLTSNKTRIPDFLREVGLDYFALIVLLVDLLPGTGTRRPCLDRTEWDFGQCQVHGLLVTVGGPGRLPRAVVRGIARQPQR